MRRVLSLPVMAALLIPFLTVLPAAAQSADGEQLFMATLSGDAEVPPVDVNAGGSAALRLDGDTLEVKVVTYGLTDVTAAHIHVGEAGTNGPVVVPLFGPSDGVDRDGLLVTRSITGAQVGDPEGFGGTLADLVAALEDGDAYVNVHTAASPAGAIRGQITGLDIGDAFEDDDGSTHEGAIDIAAAADILLGTSAGDVASPSDLSRGQMAAILTRALGLPPSDIDPFDDNVGVFQDDVNALAAAGITLGCSETRYCPGNTVTRAQMATFLVRALDLSGAAGIDAFDDVGGGFHAASIAELFASGITIGFADGTFGPTMAVTRGEMATFVVRAIGFVDVDPPVGLELTVLHNNDGESAVTADGDVGGVARFKTVVDQARSRAASETDGSILVSSGDNFLAGTAFTASRENDTFYDAIALEALGYDAIALGNHDFDFGPDVLAEFIRAFEDPPPYLSANLDFSAEEELEALVEADVIQPRTVVEVGDVPIGIVGATTPLLAEVSSPRGVAVDADVAGVVQAQIDELEADGVHHVVLISHLQDIDTELALIPDLSGVDVVVAGGGTELLANSQDALVPPDGTEDGEAVFGPYPLTGVTQDGHEIPVVTTSGAYRYLGQLIVDFDLAGRVVGIGDDSGVIGVDGQEQDAGLLETVEDPVAEFEEALAEEVIGTSEVDLNGIEDDVRSQETNLGNLITDGFLFEGTRRAAEFGVPEPDVSLTNGGGVRGNEVIPAGDITVLDTFIVQPFGNFLSIVPDLSREHFTQLLEHAVSAELPQGRFAQIGGFSVTYDLGGTAQELDEDGTITTEGTRVVDVTLDDGTEIVVDGEVQSGDPLALATSAFTARGGDGYPFRGADFVTLGITDQETLANFIESDGGLGGDITAADYPEGGEGRITIE